MDENDNICPFCTELCTSTDNFAVLSEKGCKGIEAASKKRNDTVVKVTVGQRVHSLCRQRYINANVIEKDLREASKRSAEDANLPDYGLRSKVQQFNLATCCMLCGTEVNLNITSGPDASFKIRTFQMQNALAEKCNERNDEWADIVKGKLEYARDLHASDAVYHKSCSSNFRTVRLTIPKRFQSRLNAYKLSSVEPSSSGRKTDSLKLEAFEKTVQYLKDNDDEQVTITELVEKMKEFSGGLSYTQQYFKEKVLEKFGDGVIVTEINGKANVVTFRATAKVLLHDFYTAQKGTDDELEKVRLVKAAAALIKSDIKSSTVTKALYPSTDVIESLQENLAFVPESLRVLLREIFSERDADRKIAAIGQAIVQAARPRVQIAPLQIGLGVQMHHHFGSRLLIDSLSTMGFCSSYSEVQRFEANAAVSHNTDIPDSGDNVFLQYVADNVDHNTCTLDGNFTFHGMGIVASATPGTRRATAVPRLNITSKDIKDVGTIDITYYQPNGAHFGNITYNEVQDLRVLDPSVRVDLLWKVSWPLRPTRPAWSGVMQAVHQGGTHPGKSNIYFMPMIDLNPGDLSCIYSTLLFVSKEARRHDSTPVITFDQPLYWKAHEIITNKPEEQELNCIVLRLGVFHMEMSFMGCIGRLMEGSGLQELLELAYAPNAVVHMLQGKAVSRAFRGLNLADSSLNAVITSKVFEVSLPGPILDHCADIDVEDLPQDVLDVMAFEEVAPSTDTQLEPQEPSSAVESSLSSDGDLVLAAEKFDKLLTGDIAVTDLCHDENISLIQQKIKLKMLELKSYPTAALWLQFMYLVDILRRLIKAERTGNWNLHLSTVREMMPFMAAAGHNLYTKSLYLYLQDMMQLEQTHPDVYASFQIGHHVIRRSDRLWAGLSSDFVIEQVLMRSVKSTGGLTRGRGMSEAQRTVWLLGMPACAAVNGAMQSFADIQYATSEEHVDLTNARQKQDEKNVRELVGFLESRDPFEKSERLKNIVTGEVAHPSVNAHQSLEVGHKILQKMLGQTIQDFTFRRCNQATTMVNASKNALKIGEDVVSIDPQLLFQRLVSTVSGSVHVREKADAFKYELSAYPNSLFESPLLPLESKKSDLADEVWKSASVNMPSLPEGEDVQFVIDGGALLHLIPWSRRATFASIIQSYVNYITRKFHGATVVFDGYLSGPSTKDPTHLRRLKTKACTDVEFELGMTLNIRKEVFLANKNNKQRFIRFLSDALFRNSCTTVCADGDADMTIIAMALESAKQKTTIVIGDDTDLLVLLCHHVTENDHDVFLQRSHRSRSEVLKRWHIQHTKRNLNTDFDLCNLLPFIHAMSGCDTTSRPFGIGKRGILNKFKKSADLREAAAVFTADPDDIAQETIIQAGERMLIILYDGTANSLDELRFKVFCTKVATGTAFLKVHSLPPTSAAAKYHSMRVYYQVQEWLGNSKINELDWGWKKIDNRLVPVTTDLPPAPPELLSVIRCGCKTGCDTKQCTCRKHGLDCSPACVECSGVQCSNSERISPESE